MGTGNPIPTVARTMDHPAHSMSLYQLRYPSCLTLVLKINSNYFPLKVSEYSEHPSSFDMISSLAMNQTLVTIHTVIC
jgi:hypothetical protein